jgi:hypothetical protein
MFPRQPNLALLLSGPPDLHQAVILLSVAKEMEQIPLALSLSKGGHYGRSGTSLVEIMMVMALMALVAVLFYPVINVSQSGSVNFEANFQMRNAGQVCLQKMSHALVQCKRLFGNNAGDLTFLNPDASGKPLNLDLGGLPPPIVESRLPVKEADQSPATAAKASVGNSLFLASLNRSQDLNPIAITGSPSEVTVDIYRFYYYYVGAVGGHDIGGKSKRTLWRWESVDYADYGQLIAITDLAKSTNTVAILMALGVNYAWDHSQLASSQSFYKFNPNILTMDGIDVTFAVAAPPEPAHALKKKSGESMISVLTAITGSGYAYGVSPNSSAQWITKHKVPQFTDPSPSGEFPSGFEALVTGYPSNRQVLIRLVLAAKVGSHNLQSYEQVQITAVRDIW